MSVKIRDKFDYICSPENLYRAAHRTLLKGLRFRRHGANWKIGQEYHLLKLSAQLKERRYKHGPYEVFKVYDPKERIILAATISDRVVHHALHDVIEPVIDRKFIHHNYACRMGKGQHRGLKAAQEMMRRYDYWIHLDVRKYFYSIDRAHLLSVIRRSVEDEGVDWLLTTIIDSSNRHAYSGQQPQAQASQLSLFEPSSPVVEIPLITDDKKGLPIGNLTSQLLANWYLNELDQHVKHRLKHSAYIRYMDDMVLFDNKKERLIGLEREITEYCRDILKLSLHPSGGPSSYREGLSFLGFRIFRDHMRVKSEAVKRFRRKLAYYVDHIPYRTKEGFKDLHARVQSWNAHASFGDTLRLRKEIFGKYPVTKYMMENHLNINKMNQTLKWK